jgi:glycosyltransferase involved in cell wall biosynthesis
MVCSHDYLGGAARAAYRLHRALLASGAQSVFLTQHKVTTDPTVFGVDERTAILRVWADQLTLRMLRVPRGVFRSPAWVGVNLPRRVSQHPSDVVHLHWINAGFVRPESLARIGRPLVWTLHDEWAFQGALHYSGDGPRHWVDRVVAARKRRAYARLESLTLVAPSRWMAEAARASELLGDRRIEVIPYCIDTSTYRPHDKREARRALGLPQDETLLLFAGNVQDPRKGFDVLVDAGRRLKGVRIVVAGPNPPSGVLGLGPIADESRLALAYCAADAVVCPSLSDNLPNVVMEAMACGRACVASRTGGLPELVEDGVTGALSTPGDGADLAAALSRVLADPERFGAAGARRALAWSYANVAERHLALYRSLS